ncbi:MAG TPA: DUF5367 family protein [Caulobacterales bacterium]|nr:DUF5367 family protein [Caulobacterales bacterium]
MIIRAMGLGFLLWLAVAALFRFAGQYFFLPDESARLICFVAAPILGVVAAFVLLKLLREAPGDEGEAAVAVAFPSLLLDAFVVRDFSRVMPNLDPTLDTEFAALMLIFCAGILFTGLLMTHLAPQDEKV